MSDKNDSISRKAAINELKKIIFLHWFEYGEYLSEDTKEIEIISSSRALKAMRALPPTQLKPHEGHWIISSDGYYPYCSECKSELKSGEMTDFCPSCGAKMNNK